MNAAAMAKPVNALGEFFVLSAASLVATFRRTFAWREFLEQISFVARVAVFPTTILSIPYTLLLCSAAIKPRSSSREYGDRRKG